MKLTVSTMVGSLYESEERHPLRDAGFSIFYISVNISSFFGPLLIGLLQENIGFYFGFGAAAVGMALGLSIYASKRAVLPHTPPLNPLPDSQKKTAAAIALAGAAASGVLNTGAISRKFCSRACCWRWWCILCVCSPAPALMPSISVMWWLIFRCLSR